MKRMRLQSAQQAYSFFKNHIRKRFFGSSIMVLKFKKTFWCLALLWNFILSVETLGTFGGNKKYISKNVVQRLILNTTLRNILFCDSLSYLKKKVFITNCFQLQTDGLSI